MIADASEKSFATCEESVQYCEYSERENRRSYFTNPADVLVARLLVEAEVFVQSESNVVAVQPIRELLVVQEMLFECTGNR